ncbi:MAG: Outer rane receptor for ferrienterochelin and colicin, partial [Candidatus Eremiobacteraeota bacterium]|nr:Outer rane receptor for ferrienterochelin and colicin [Candidatus Eremiobacteraeota bacterium]
ATADANGFFNLNGLAPDTYTVLISTKGYQDVAIAGVTVVQDQSVQVNPTISHALQTIGRTASRNGSNLVQPSQTADVYSVTSQQLGAAAGIGGHRTLYDVIQTAPGVTSTGVAGRPRIRGSDAGDVAWEFDGIPINDRLTGLFTTNLSIVGAQNLEVYTGGFNAQYGNAGAGVINSVVKRGTNPGFGSLTYTMGLPLSEHDTQAEYGGATRDGKWSWYGSLDFSNSDSQFGSGYQPYVIAQATTARDTTPSTQVTRDYVGNVHFRPTANDDLQFLVQSGNQRIPWNKGLTGNTLGVKPCNGVVVQPGTGNVLVGGTSDSGAACNSTGLQYFGLNQQNANVWYHYSNLGKIQWNHVFNDKLFATFRVAENFNQYIFDQPFDNANFSGTLLPGTPALKPNGFQNEYDDRRSQMYIAQADFTFTPSAHSTYYGGLVYERDNSAERYYDRCGCDEAGFGSGYNNDGSFNRQFLTVDYPLILPAAYIGTKQTFGKLVVEPSLRFDGETYDIPNRPDTVSSTGVVTKSYAYGPYSYHSWSPRFAFTWSTDQYSAIRGSYGTTTTFVPAAYVFNDSPNGVFDDGARPITPYYPGANIAPQRNYNVDLSYSHALHNGVDSWRVSPFYRHAVDKLELTKSIASVNSSTGVPTFTGVSYFRTGIQNRATGVEFGFNHVVRGDGLTWYLSGTYVNYWGSVTAGTLAGGTPYGSITSNSAGLAAFLTTSTLYRNPSQPPWSASWTGDYRHGRAHVDPFLIYQVGAPYNVVGTTYLDPATGKTVVDNQVHFARANYWASLDFGYDIVKSAKRTVTLGINVRNLFDQQVADVYPSTNSAYGKGNNPDLGTYGPSSVPNTLYYYAPDAQTRQLQLYLSTKF